MTKRIRIVIAEDHETVREGLKLILSAQPDLKVVAEAGDGISAVRHACELSPDIVLMDVTMPLSNGLKATENIKRLCPKVKVLALTRHKDAGYLQQVLKAGASGYVLKQSSAAELLHAIRAVAAGGKYLDPAVAEKILNRYSERSVPPQSEGKRNLTAREEEVLRCIAWGYSNKEIAAQLSISVKTVEVHKANSIRKLGMTSRIDIVRFAVLQGWLQDP